MTRSKTVPPRRGPAALAALLILAGLGPAARDASADYTAVDLGALGSSTTLYGSGLNASGQSVGYSNNVGFAATGQANSMTPFLLTGGFSSFLSAINNNGLAVGYGTSSSGTVSFSYNVNTPAVAPTILSDNPNFGIAGAYNSYAQGVNNSGQIVGYSLLIGQGAYLRAFLFDGTTTVSLGTLPGSTGNTAAQAVNASGQVVGYGVTASGSSHAFLYSNGAMKDLGSLLAGTNSFATDLNGSGLIVGYSGTRVGGVSYEHAFVDDGTTMTDLTPTGAYNSRAYGVDAKGEVVGYYGSFSGLSHGFLYSGGVLTDLGNVVSGWTITGAYGINDNGQILAMGTNDNGQTSHALLLSTTVAVAEPPTIALLCSGAVVGLGLRRLARRRITALELAEEVVAG